MLLQNVDIKNNKLKNKILYLMSIPSFKTVFATGNDIWSATTAPITQLIDSLLGPALTIVGSIGAIYCVIVGVKFAKAEEQQDREKAKASLKNSVIGFGLIFVLIAALKLGLPVLTDWLNTQVTTKS